MQCGEPEVEDNVLVDLVEEWLDPQKRIPLDAPVLVKNVRVVGERTRVVKAHEVGVQSQLEAGAQGHIHAGIDQLQARVDVIGLPVGAAKRGIEAIRANKIAGAEFDVLTDKVADRAAEQLHGVADGVEAGISLIVGIAITRNVAVPQTELHVIERIFQVRQTHPGQDIMPHRRAGDNVIGFARHPINRGVKYPPAQVAIHRIAEINRIQTGNMSRAHDVSGIVVEMDAPFAVPPLDQEIFPGEARDSHLVTAGLREINESGNRVLLEQLQINHVVTQTVLQELAENTPAQPFVIEDQSVKVGLEGLDAGTQKGEIEVILAGVEEVDIHKGIEDVVVIGRCLVDRIDVELVVEDAIDMKLKIRRHEDIRVVAQLEAVENVLIEEVIVREKSFAG